MLSEVIDYRQTLTTDEQMALDSFIELLADLLVKYQEDCVADESADAA